MRRILFSLLVCILFMASCAPATPVAVATATTSLTPSPTPSPTRTRFPTWTPTPSSTLLALHPTLLPKEAQAFVLELIATNGNCDLPCWWGITPGNTTWKTTNEFLATFATSILEFYEPNLFYGVLYDNLPEDISEGAVSASISVESGIVQSISTDIYFPMAEILEKYGQPNEVWIFADAQSINREAPFTIALFYRDKGILSIYNGSTDKGKTLKICPSAIGGDQLAWFLWNPELNLTFEQAGPNSLLFDTHPSDRPFFRLEDAANIDVATFYETYKEPENSNTCFELLIQ